MSKKCNLCGRNKYLSPLTDGYACNFCGRIYQSLEPVSSNKLRELWLENGKRLSKFKETKKISSSVGGKVSIDYNNKFFYFCTKDKTVTPIVFAFNEIEEYTTEVLGQKQVTKLSIGILTNSLVTKLSDGIDKMEITLNSIYGRHKIGILYYSYELSVFLDECINKNKEIKKASYSNIEEVKKYKQLLDCGIITESEFNSKKKELLNL